MLKHQSTGIFVLILLCNSFSSCGAEKIKPVNKERNTVWIKADSIITDLTESQRKILFGAKKCLEDKFRYDFEMAYRELNYKNGEFMGEKVYP